MKVDYSRIYRKWHSDTPEHRAEMSAYYRRILGSHLPQDRQARILDVGCGMGFTMLALRDMGCTAIAGIDSDESQVQTCRAKGLDATLTGDSAGFLRSQPGLYNVILALDLIEHIPVEEQLQFVRALATALAPEGKLICTVPNANSILALRYRYICWTHRSSFTEHSLDFLLFNGGFRQINIIEVESIQRPRFPWLPISGSRHWWAFRFFRLWRRLEMMAELGPDQGRGVPLSLNLMGIASVLSHK